MAVFVNRALGIGPRCDLGSSFTDVPGSDAFFGWIESFAAQGITGGCAVGMFCPNSSVTRGQMAVFIVRAFGLARTIGDYTGHTALRDNARDLFH